MQIKQECDKSMNLYERNPELAKHGNIRDYTDLLHLVILNKKITKVLKIQNYYKNKLRKIS